MPAPVPPPAPCEQGFWGVVSFGPSIDVNPFDVARFCCLSDADVTDEQINSLVASYPTIVGFAGTAFLKKLHVTQKWTNVNQWSMELRVPAGFWAANGFAVPTIAQPLLIRVGMSCYSIERPVWQSYPSMGMYTQGDCHQVSRFFGPTVSPYQAAPQITSTSAFGCFQQSFYPQYDIPLTYEGLSQDLWVFGDNGCMINIQFPFGELFSVFPAGIEHHSRQITIDRLLYV